MRTLTVLFSAALASTARAQGDGGLAASMEEAYQRAADKAAPSVVAVWVTREAEKEPSTGNSMLTGGVFVRRPKDAPASGTIVDEDGHIITSYFNVNGKVKTIRVTLADGSDKEAQLLGYDSGADVALLKIEAAGLPTLKPSPMAQLKVGTPIVAVGRAPDGKGLTINPGIVSAPARINGRGVQTDARMNYGNVGGPLVDAQGRLVGVTCKVDVKWAASFGQNSGVSFAVTWDQLERLLPDLKKGLKRQGTGQPFLGVVWNQNTDEKEGVPIESVVAGGSAEAGGIKPGDVILEFGGEKTQSFDDLRAGINRRAIGDKVKVKLRRGEEILELTIPLGERPE